MPGMVYGQMMSDRKYLRNFSSASLGGLGIATVSGFFGDLAWWLDVLAHFRLHFCIGAIVVIGLGIIVRRRLVAVMAVALLAINVFALGPQSWTSGAVRAETGSQIRIVSINLRWRNRHTPPVIAFLRRQDADIVFLAEVNESWRSAVQSLADLYPYQFYGPDYAPPEEIPHGQVMLSKQPWRDAGVIAVPKGRRHFGVWAQFGAGAAVVRVYGVHLAKPFLARDENQAEDVDRLIAELNEQAGGLVVVGDFNMTPYSAVYRRLTGSAGLHRADAGYAASWPSVLGPLGLPIDHVMTRGDAIAAIMRIGPDLGSDHLPVSADLEMTLP